jgi:hypothetical protein
MHLGQSDIVHTDTSTAALDDAAAGGVDLTQYTDVTPVADPSQLADPSAMAVDVASADDAAQGVYMRAAAGQPVAPAEAANAGLDVTQLFKTIGGAVMQFAQAKNQAGQTVYVARPVTQSALPSWAIPAAIIGIAFLLA